jgi:hypothetical protein
LFTVGNPLEQLLGVLAVGDDFTTPPSLSGSSFSWCVSNCPNDSL